MIGSWVLGFITYMSPVEVTLYKEIVNEPNKSSEAKDCKEHFWKAFVSAAENLRSFHLTFIALTQVNCCKLF